jgi:hypothetical protein
VSAWCSLVRCCHRLSSTALRVGAGSRFTRRIHDRGSMGAFAYDGPAHGAPLPGLVWGPESPSVRRLRGARTRRRDPSTTCVGRRAVLGSDPRDDLWYMRCVVHVQYEGAGDTLPTTVIFYSYTLRKPKPHSNRVAKRVVLGMNSWQTRVLSSKKEVTKASFRAFFNRSRWR